MEERHLIRIAKALADPTRFGILRAIAERGEICCGELVELFPVAQPTISHHLKVLSNAGLVESRREGQFHHFRMVRSTLEEYLSSLGIFLSEKGLEPRAPEPGVTSDTESRTG